MPGRMLVGVDGSAGSREALRWAVEEATVRGAAIEALIAWQSSYDFGELIYFPVDESKTARSASEQLTASVADVAGPQPVLEIDPVVVKGDPAATLCARTIDFDLLVVGSRGHRTFAELLLGSVSSKCARHRSCPVTIIPMHHATPPSSATASRARIVVGVDGSPGSLRALGWALEEGTARRARVEAVCVWHGSEGDSALEIPNLADIHGEERATDSGRERLAGAIAEVTDAHRGVEVEARVLQGDPAQTLCNLREDADLLVVGSRGHGTFDGLLLGSVSSKCAHHSPGPMVIISIAE